VGALNEGVGHGNRVARFLRKADTIADGSDGARVLKKGAKSVSGRLSRPSSGVSSASVGRDSQPAVVAQLSNVTFKNPANITLIQDLTMQARNRLQSARARPPSVAFARFPIESQRISSLLMRPPTPHSPPQICSGKGCLIAGPSGCGKSSLLRVMGRCMLVVVVVVLLFCRSFIIISLSSPYC